MKCWSYNRFFEVFANRDNLRLLNEYFERFNVPVADRGVPAVFVGSSYLVGDADILDGLEGLLQSCSDGDGSSVVVDELVEEGGAYGSEGSDGMGCLSFLAITVAALVDSINPCSMAILFFLLAGLLLLRKRKKALRVGLAFTLSVFVANLLFGFGILSAVVLTGLSGVFKVAAGVIAILTGVLLLKDAFFYGAGGFKMEVPEFLRPYLKRRLSKAFYGKSSSLIGAFLVGFLVTSFEVPCTGGPYFYVLARMADDATRMQTIPILLYYNLIFVMPLVLITVLLYFGSVHVERAREWKDKNKQLIGLARGLPMVAVGLVTVPTWQVISVVRLFLNVYRVVFIPVFVVLALCFWGGCIRRCGSRKGKMILGGLLVFIVGLAVVGALALYSLNNYEKRSDVGISSLSSCSTRITECCIIDKPDVYYLDADLVASGNCIIITADYTVLIGGNHKITGDGNGNGINITANNVNVADIEIKNFFRGIWIRGNSNIVTRCKIYNTSRGITLFSGEGNTVKQNIIVNNYKGILLATPQETYIYDNFVANNSWKNIFDEASISNDFFNKTKTLGENIISGPYLGGNYWDDYEGNDTDGDGLGEEYYLIRCNSVIPEYCSKDYLPLVDIVPPHYNLEDFDLAQINTTLSITWIDNVQLDTVILEFDGTNYTDLVKVNESLSFSEEHNIWSIPVQHKVTYSKTFTNLTLGTHYYRWYANDTSGYWNSTELLSFNVTATPQITNVEITPTLEIQANITCQGVNNISEAIEQVQVYFKIDDNWFSMPMTYNQTTKLYTALLPAYNQLANKTIEYYIMARDIYGNALISNPQTYHVPEWVVADVNRDGKVDCQDMEIVKKYLGTGGSPIEFPTRMLR